MKSLTELQAAAKSEPRPLAERPGKLLFYPSCGESLRELFRLEFATFVLADCGPRSELQKDGFFQCVSRGLGGVELLHQTSECRIFRRNQKFGYLFFRNNNEVLQTIKASNAYIDCLVGIRDGCVEGGNDECVNDLDFMSKVMDLVPVSGMTYLTDHSPLLSTTRPNNSDLDAPRAEIILMGKTFARVGLHPNRLTRDPWGPIHEYRITPHRPTVRLWSNGRLRVTLEHTNVAGHVHELDGVFASSRCRRVFCTGANHTRPARFKSAPDHYFKPTLRQGWSSEASTTLLLEYCLRERWSTVGTTAFGEGSHRQMMEVIDHWRGDFPRWIRVFHFDSEDFLDIRDNFDLVTDVAQP